MNLLNSLFCASTINVLNVSVVGAAIVLGIAVLATILVLTVKCQVVFVDPDGDYEIGYRKLRWLAKVELEPASKEGKEFVGWSIDPEGKYILTEKEFMLTRTIQLYAVWADVKVAEEISEEALEGVFVQFNYMDAEGEELLDSETIKINTLLPEEQDVPVVVNGWSFEKQGDIVICKDDVSATFTINLYPVFSEEVVDTDNEIDTASVVELLFVDSNTDRFIYKESHYVNLNTPADYDDDINFLGWAAEQNGEPVIERSEVDSVFTIQLYSVDAEAVEEIAEDTYEFVEVIEEPIAEEVIEEPVVEEVVEEPVAEEVIEEPVAEEVVEEPVAEEVVEEPVAEEVVEEPVVEEVVEEPVAEEVIEEPVAEEVVEEPVAEEVIEEPVAEEVIEEPVAEEVIEEPVAEEVIEEPVAEEVVEEPVAEEVIEEPVAEEAVEEPVAEEVVEEPVVEEPAPVVEEIVPVIVPTYIDNEGNKIDIKYSRSFTANIIQADETVKDYYSQLKNHILSYKGVKARISWKFDSYNRGRDQLFKMKLRGKTICLYCAIDPNELDASKYHHDAIDAKIFADVPTLLKIKSGLGLRKAKEVVDLVMAKFEIVKDEKAKTVDYVAKYPYEENEPLLARKLIKALVADSDIVVVSSKPKEEPVVEEVVEPVVEEVAEEPVAEEPIAEEPVAEEPIAEEPIAEEPVAEEPIAEEPIAEEPVAEEPVAEEPIAEEPVAEEPVAEEPIAEEPVAEEPVVDEQGVETVEINEPVYVESVTAEEAHEILEEKQIEVKVDESVEYITKNDTKKCIVNIDTLSKEFEAGQVVDLASLKAKKLIDKKAKSIKVLARGTLDKALVVKAGDFSKTAIEMIVLTGGKAIHVNYEIKK
ncbi:MAG: uL15 family ribosomal protein [Clostridia bacterium]|nr:uL15 family ribosomal protein [Clostridia bacterium]